MPRTSSVWSRSWRASTTMPASAAMPSATGRWPGCSAIWRRPSERSVTLEAPGRRRDPTGASNESSNTFFRNLNMKEAVIVSTARTPIGRAFRGAFNNTKSPTLMGHALSHAVQRAGIDAGEIEDVIVGTALSAGTAGLNIARYAALAAGIPVTAGAQTVDRQCSSGLMAIGMAAKQIIVDGMEVVAAGGQDNISAVQAGYFEWAAREKDPNVEKFAPHAYMPMLLTAENVAKKFGISREAQDLYALSSQQRTAAAKEAGRFDQEIVPLTTMMAVVNKDTKEVSYKEVTLAKDEGNRAATTLEGLAGLKPVVEGGCVTGGNASQLSDGASPLVRRADAAAGGADRARPRLAQSVEVLVEGQRDVGALGHHEILV